MQLLTFFIFLKNSNLVIYANNYVEKTLRITTGSDGKIILQEVFLLFLFAYKF